MCLASFSSNYTVLILAGNEETDDSTFQVFEQDDNEVENDYRDNLLDTIARQEWMRSV